MDLRAEVIKSFHFFFFKEINWFLKGGMVQKPEKGERETNRRKGKEGLGRVMAVTQLPRA